MGGTRLRRDSLREPDFDFLLPSPHPCMVTWGCYGSTGSGLSRYSSASCLVSGCVDVEGSVEVSVGPSCTSRPLTPHPSQTVSSGHESQVL